MNDRESRPAHSTEAGSLKAGSLKPGSFAGLVFALTLGTALLAAEPASQNDRDLAAKVSQGGLYEVEAGKVAATKGQTPFTKNFGVLETHDHEGVNAELKHIAGVTGVAVASGLNPEFAERLAKLKAVPAARFDAYKPFAHQTAVLVAAHLGWLNTQ